MIGPASSALAVWEWMIRWFGPEWEARKGIHFFSERHVWPCGAEFWREHRSTGSCAVELSGSVLALFDGCDRVEMLRELRELGLKPSRLDICIDRWNPAGGLDLVQNGIASCEAGEKCRFRTWEPVVKYRDGERVSHGFTLGARGNKGGGVYVRCYDKGLERNAKIHADFRPDTWHRWEVEFSNAAAGNPKQRDLDNCADPYEFCGHAEKALDELLESDDWTRAAFGLALGVADFRKVTGRAELTGPRARPRVAWFAEMIDVGQAWIRKSVRRVAASLEGYVGHARRTWGRTLVAIAEASMTTPQAVVAEMLDGVGPGGSKTIIDGWKRHRIDLLRSIVDRRERKHGALNAT